MSRFLLQRLSLFVFICQLVGLLLGIESGAAIAQSPPPAAPDPDITNPNDTLPRPSVPPLPSTLPSEDTPELEVEPADPSREPGPTTPAPAGEQFQVGAIELLGMTLDPEQLTVVSGGETVSVSDRIATLEGQLATLEDLLSLRSFITEAYISAGYITSGAFIPEQAFVDGGTVQIQVVEGDLELVEVNGLERLQTDYVRSRIHARTPRPLNQADIESALQLLQQDPLIKTVNAQLLAGSGAGQSILVLDLAETPPLSAGVSVNSYRSPSIGSEQITPYIGYTNLLGIGDRLDVNYALTRGLNSYGITYAVPVNPQDGTLTLSVATGNSLIVEDPFQTFDIRNNSSTYSLGFRQPLVRSPNTEFALGLAFDLRRSQSTFAGNQPFGTANVSVLRFSQDWVDRTPSRVLAARSQFSLGVNAFDATISDTAPDGRFLSWQGQFQWVQQLSENQLLVTRLASQLSSDSLLSLEQFSLGGVRTVRGYRDNQLVRDNGLAGSLELRLPLSNPPEVLQLTPFLEGGIGWNSGGESELTGLASVGLGLRWQVDTNTRLRLDYGYPLTPVEGDKTTLQENGFTFSLDWAL